MRVPSHLYDGPIEELVPADSGVVAVDAAAPYAETGSQTLVLYRAGQHRGGVQRSASDGSVYLGFAHVEEAPV